MRMKDEEWDEIMATNLRSVFRLSKLVIRGMMKARAGRIINIGSVVGAMAMPARPTTRRPRPGSPVSPGRSPARSAAAASPSTAWPGVHRDRHDRGARRGPEDRLVQQIPLGRLGSPEDIAAAVVYLASPGGAYVTGTTLHVNGGMFMN